LKRKSRAVRSVGRWTDRKQEKKLPRLYFARGGGKMAEGASTLQTKCEDELKKKGKGGRKDGDRHNYKNRWGNKKSQTYVT